jgi:hypothetical protein
VHGRCWLWSTVHSCCRVWLRKETMLMLTILACLSSFQVSRICRRAEVCHTMCNCAVTPAMIEIAWLWQVIPKRHPRQPTQTGPSWPALVHKGFLAAWTAGGFRCCFNPPSAV